MSADLLAEFGRPESAAGDDSRKLSELIGTSLDDFEPTEFAGQRDECQASLWRTDDNGTTVLFDASIDQYDLNDEFGDFEDGEQEGLVQPENLLHDDVLEKTPSAAAIPLQTLLDLEESTDSPHPSNHNDKQDHEDEWGDFSAAVSTEKSRQTKDGAAKPGANFREALPIDETLEKEGWAAFEDGEGANFTQYSQITVPIRPRATHESRLHSSSQPQVLSSTERASAITLKDESRPTNIPPPAILLQALPRVFENLADVGIVQEPMQCARAILKAHNVASYLMAGRTLRWKRDNILSQSTKIGPAVAGRKGGGMKLAAIDKTEGLKEERELADVVQAWEKHAHVFNSTIHKAGIRRPLMTLSGQFRPRPAKGAGVLISPHACALCGLRRDERVLEVDHNVDDLFGEFWIEHWGHHDCRDFWHENQDILPQR